MNTHAEHSLALAAVITLAVLVVLGWIFYRSHTREQKQNHASTRYSRRPDSGSAVTTRATSSNRSDAPSASDPLNPLNPLSPFNPINQPSVTSGSECTSRHSYDPTPSFSSAADYGGGSCSSTSSSSSSCSSD